jgi:hypothetical protein
MSSNLKRRVDFQSFADTNAFFVLLLTFRCFEQPKSIFMKHFFPTSCAQKEFQSTKIFRVLISSLLAPLFVTSSLIAQTWNWATSASCDGGAKGSAIAEDASGNVFVIGSFSSPSVTFGSTTLNCSGGSDGFIVKYDPNGAVVWATSIGGTGNDYFQKILYSNGNLYVAAWSDSPQIDLNGSNVTNDYVNYLLLMVINASTGVVGNFKQLEGDLSEEVHLALNPSTGGIVVGGGYTDDLVIGGLTIPNVYTNHDDIFFMSFSSQFSFQWHRSYGGNYIDQVKDVAADAAGNVYMLAVSRSPSLQFEMLNPQLFFSGGQNYLLGKWDANGTLRYTRYAGGVGSDLQVSMTAGFPTGFVNVIGSCDGQFGYNSITLTTAGGKDLFLVRYDQTGSIVSADLYGGTGNETSPVLTTSANGDIFFGGTSTSPSFSIGPNTVTNAGTPDAFLSMINQFGQDQWATSIGAIGDEQLYDISVDDGGNVYATGSFGSSTLTLGGSTVTFSGTKDTYVARLNELGTFTGVTSITGTGQELLGDVHIGSSHRLILTGAFSGPSITCGSTAVNQSSTLADDFFVAGLEGNFVTVPEQLLADESLVAFPNPMQGQLTVKLKTPVKNATLELIDAQGRVAKSITGCNGSEFVVPRDHLSNGLYLLKVSLNTHLIGTQKILVAN